MSTARVNINSFYDTIRCDACPMVCHFLTGKTGPRNCRFNSSGVLAGLKGCTVRGSG